MATIAEVIVPRAGMDVVPSHIDLDDLYNTGVIGLMDAIEKYDPDKNCKFKTYAEFRIKGAILDQLRSLDWVPRSVRQKSRKLEKAYGEVEQRLGRSATEDEVADCPIFLTGSASEIRERLEKRREETGINYVVISAPLDETTRGMFGEAAFAAMKPGVLLINVGRGPIVRTDALLDALRRGAIAGATLDVFEEEPLPPSHPPWAMPQVTITAHMAGDFFGWREALARQTAELLEAFAAERPLFNVVSLRGDGNRSRGEG